MAKSSAHKVFFGDAEKLYATHMAELHGRARLIYLDPPYNSRRNRGARKHYTDSNGQWSSFMEQIIRDSHAMLRADGFLAVSINQMELFNLKNILDRFFPGNLFVGLFPVKIRHRDRQLMINATYHDVYEYLLIYRKTKSQRFFCDYKNPDLQKFVYRIHPRTKSPVIKKINGKTVEIYEKGQCEILKAAGDKTNFRKYTIAGKLKTANWSGVWFEKHLRKLGPDKLVKVHGLENSGLGYRWFGTQTAKRDSGIYFQSCTGAGRPILPCNDLDFTEEMTNIYKEGGEGCDFKDSKKPERLLAWLLDITTEKNDLVLDLFGGSGTTLSVAAHKGRQCYIVENSKTSYAILKRRILNLSADADRKQKIEYVLF